MLFPQKRPEVCYNLPHTIVLRQGRVPNTWLKYKEEKTKYLFFHFFSVFHLRFDFFFVFRLRFYFFSFFAFDFTFFRFLPSNFLQILPQCIIYNCRGYVLSTQRRFYSVAQAHLRNSGRRRCPLTNKWSFVEKFVRPRVGQSENRKFIEKKFFMRKNSLREEIAPVLPALPPEVVLPTAEQCHSYSGLCWLVAMVGPIRGAFGSGPPWPSRNRRPGSSIVAPAPWCTYRMDVEWIKTNSSHHI